MPWQLSQLNAMYSTGVCASRWVCVLSCWWALLGCVTLWTCAWVCVASLEHVVNAAVVVLASLSCLGAGECLFYARTTDIRCTLLLGLPVHKPKSAGLAQLKSVATLPSAVAATGVVAGIQCSKLLHTSTSCSTVLAHAAIASHALSRALQGRAVGMGLCLQVPAVVDRF